MDVSTIALIILSLLGIAFPLAGMFMLKNYMKIRIHGKKTRAKVVEIIEEQASEGITYRLVVEFTSNKGVLIREKLEYSTGFKPKKKLPYPLDIFYLEENNKMKILPVNNSLYFIISIIFILVGVFCLTTLGLELTGYINIFTQ